MKRFALILTSLGAAACLLAGCAASDGGGDGVTRIELSDEKIQISGGGAKSAGGTVTISAVGTYTISGTLSDGQLVVDTGDEAVDVTLILDGAEITCLTGPALHIRQAKDTRLQLAEGSVNRLTSGTEAEAGAAGADSSGAALYAEDDLDIDGPGSLEVRGYINNGITCKDDLDINGGDIAVVAVNNGIRGSESVDIKGGTITVEAGNDGVKSTSADKEGKGAVTVSGGTVSITASGDGIAAETVLTVEGGTLSVAATGDPEQGSSKALKAKTGLTISDGTVTLSAADHAIHSTAGLTISGGTVTAVSTGGKALAAHGDIVLSGGELVLEAADDGVETPENITVSGGTVTLTAGDDGMQAGEANTGRGDVTFDGGEVRISAKGRNINARGALRLNGGTLAALGGSDKVAVPAAGGQLCLHVGWTGPAGRTVTLTDEAGETLLSVEPAYAYHVLLLSSPALEEGQSYSLFRDGQTTPVRAGRS